MVCKERNHLHPQGHITLLTAPLCLLLEFHRLEQKITFKYIVPGDGNKREPEMD